VRVFSLRLHLQFLYFTRVPCRGLKKGKSLLQVLPRGGSREGGARPPYFLAKSILFFTLYTMYEKIFLKLNFDFIVSEIRGVFGSVGVYVCVSVWSHRPTRQISRFLSNIGGFRNRGRYCFLFCKGPILNDIRRHSDPKNICQNRKSHLIFQNFLGEAQDPRRRSVRGFAPLPPPFPKFLDPPLVPLRNLCT